MQEPLQPRRGPSRRSRPSLAAMADSGYQPSRPSSQTVSQNNTLPRSLFSNNVLDEHPSEATDSFNQGVASQLLGGDSPLKDTKASVRISHSQTMRSMGSYRFPPLDGRRSVKSTSESSTYPSNTMSRSQTISSAWSGMSNRLFTESVSGTTNEKQTDVFTKQFDKLAKKHGIQSFPENFKAEPNSVSVSSVSDANKISGDSTPTLHGNRLWNRLLGRTPSTVDISKSYGNMKLSLGRKRGSSIGDLAAIGRGKRDSLKGMHLEDMIRLGGVSPFLLPEGLSPGDLLIPTCMHASASYILSHGLRTPGLFRVSGNLNTTYALYDYYQRQFEENNNAAVVQTIALAKLPNNVRFHVHDVAHLFKKLLHGLPGGLLGSPAIFQALYNIHTFVYPDPSLGNHMSRKVKPRMIALAIAAINFHFRIALICSVFGLLKAVNMTSEQEPESKLRDPHNTFESMKEDALGLIFGPLLLGDKSDQILLQETDDRGSLLVLPKISPAPDISSKRGKYTHRHSSAYTKMQNEKTKRAALVCEMLINDWEDISYQLKKIDALGITAQAYDLPSLRQEQPEENQEERLISQSIRASRTGSMRSRRVSTVRNRVVSDAESMNHLHSLNPPPFHKPPQLDDLILFSNRNSMEENDKPAHLNVPYLGAPPMSPVAEVSSPSRSVVINSGQSSPSRSAAGPSSPNWVAINPETPMQTPIRKRNFQGQPSQLRQSAQVEDDVGSPNSVASSTPSSPGLEVAAQAATRLQRAFLANEPKMKSGSTISAPELAPSNTFRTPSAKRLVSEIPELAFSPTTFADLDLGDFSITADPETTPRPLNIRNKTLKAKTPPAFSIFEDKPGSKPPKTPKPLSSPILTLTRPNSKAEVKLTPKKTQLSRPPTRSPERSPTRPPTRRHLPESPRPISAPLQPSTPNRRPRTTSADSDFEDQYIWQGTETPSPSKKGRSSSALYAEIRRLQRLVDVKAEEAAQAKKDLELAQNITNSGTMSHMLRETQEELKIWRNRAEWAEKQLRAKAVADKRNTEGPRPMAPKKGSMRYSLG